MAAGHDENASMFDRFLHSEVAGSVVLMLCTAVAIALVNSQWAEDYHRFAQTYVGVSWGDSEFKLSLSHWVKDGLMAIFFFVIGLEVKREVVLGELSTLRQAILPAAAAVGGALVPALLYALLNRSGEGTSGWGIPMATDIAFALGVLSLFGDRVPLALKVFLTATAIADDVLAVVVIAAFYTAEVDVGLLLAAIVFFALIVLSNRWGIRGNWVYVSLAVAVWVCVLGSGIHATIAGVLVAFAIPVRSLIEPAAFTKKARSFIERPGIDELTRESLVHETEHLRALERVILSADNLRPPGIALELALHPVQSFLILPLFALFSAGIVLDAATAAAFPSDISLGVIAGLVLGKPVGIGLACWLLARFAGVRLEGVSSLQIAGVSLLAGIGFTMSIFIAELAFTDAALIAQAKLGILVASLIAGALGCALLHLSLPKAKKG